MGRGTAPRSGVVEGLSANHCDYARCDILWISQNLPRRNSEHRNSQLCQKVVAPFIFFRSVTNVMRQTIDLDAEPGRRTIEIQHIGANRMLPPHLNRCLPKKPPQQNLR